MASDLPAFPARRKDVSGLKVALRGDGERTHAAFRRTLSEIALERVSQTRLRLAERLARLVGETPRSWRNEYSRHLRRPSSTRHAGDVCAAA